MLGEAQALWAARRARLSARAGTLVQQTAMQTWTRSVDDRPLRGFLADALHSLRTIAAQTADPGAVPVPARADGIPDSP